MVCYIFGNPVQVSAQAPGLIAGYNFNEGSRTTISDLSGNGITGTIAGATWTTSGEYGNALSFNGSTSYVDLGNPIPATDRQHDLDAWIKAQPIQPTMARSFQSLIAPLDGS